MFEKSFEMLFYTYTLIWLIIFSYLMVISLRTKKLEKRLKELEAKVE